MSGLTVTCKGSPPEITCVTASTSVVNLEVGTLKASLSTWMVVTDIMLDSEAPPTASIHVKRCDASTRFACVFTVFAELSTPFPFSC